MLAHLGRLLLIAMALLAGVVATSFHDLLGCAEPPWWMSTFGIPLFFLALYWSRNAHAMSTTRTARGTTITLGIVAMGLLIANVTLASAMLKDDFGRFGTPTRAGCADGRSRPRT